MFKTLATFDTEYSADSVEWCPAEDFKDIFVCGTYQLVSGEQVEEASSQKRLGRIYLLRVIQNGSLHLLHTVETSAILDTKWAHRSFRGEAFLGVVTSIGFLQIYRLLREDNPRLELVTETKIREGDTEILALSLDWSTGRWTDESSGPPQIVVSDSQGFVSLFSFDGQKLRLIVAQKIHDYEAWITAFDYWNPNIVYSGGDDCKFHRLDARLNLESTGSNKKHGAGVTSVHSNAEREFSLATGSYDEVLRLWDTRNIRNPISETNLGGGVWRLKWDPRNRKNILAACMYGGFRAIDCSTETSPRIIAEYNEHESIAYGCDWSLIEDTIVNSKFFEKTTGHSSLVATCSFYDHKLKLSCLENPTDEQ